MALLLKVKNAQAFVEKFNQLLNDSNHENDSVDELETWIPLRYSNSFFYTHYSPNSVWNNKAWFRVCPDDSRIEFNKKKKTSYNLIFRLHGTKTDRMTKELYSFYHTRFLEFIMNNLVDEIRKVAVTVSWEDIEGLDRFMNDDWR